MTAYVLDDQSRSNDVCLVVSSSCVVPNDVNHVLCAFVEYPASALLIEEQEHGVEERRGGGTGGGGGGGMGGALHLSHLLYYASRNVTLYSLQVII